MAIRKTPSACETLEARQLLHGGHMDGEVQPLNASGTMYLDVGNIATAFVDSSATSWAPDVGFSGGKRVRGKFPVAGTDDDALYTTRRQGNFNYTVPVTDGQYTLSLLFVDTVKKAGKRVFNIDAEGQAFETGLDIAARVGARTALTVSHDVTVTGGALDLAFTRVRGQAVLSAIALVPVAVSSPTPTPTPTPTPEPTPTPTPEPTPTPTPIPVPIPVAPSGLSAQAQSTTSVNVMWTDNSTDETGFVVERAGSDGVFAPVATLAADTVQYTDSAAAASTTYQYRVRATGSGDPSDYSNTASAVTPAAVAKWKTAASLPIAMGEVGAGIIGNKMYVVGDGTNQTLAYNIDSNSWTSGLAQRPFLGNHLGIEVVSGKLFAIGGIGAATGKLQVYDPATNKWSVKASMPFSAGSCATAVIDGKIYVAGGVVGSSPTNDAGTGTTGQAAVYDIATDTWSDLPSMPHALNHAAAATDGHLFYIFGGRGGKNDTSNGFNTVQIFDPATNTWRSSETPGSGIAPLPQGRGGMGKAVFANGEFYVMGGETKDGANANSFHTYNRVDIYNPTTNTWRRGPEMITGRHGIFPVYSNGHIYVAGGGPRSMQVNFNECNILEILDI